MNNNNNKVWLITGCSSGLGRALALAALEAGYRVGVAARKTEDVIDIIDLYPSTALELELDVTKPEQVGNAVDALMQHFGSIDVLVNNAGLGYFGAVEESDEKEVRYMFEVNFWGTSSLIRTVLPIMRHNKSGHIINISSIGGLKSFPSLGYYHATKYAVDGFSEALAKETAPLGIKVTIVVPGNLRTDWAGRSAKDNELSIDDYSQTAGAIKSWVRGISGQQEGDPVRAARAIIAVSQAEAPPLRLLLGEDALQGAREKLQELKNDFDTWESTSKSVSFT
ncbi:SDR family NAD(P)-dependent oxidoreductase [Pedobacter sp. ISL-68]|uniref:oxidoreductase n=1 Tax=unclassified Pedobacter TaxID=2628915 RepID=UPI001BE78FC0|nr:MULTISPECIES: oxidoreductase [unclassified Pedobacter]MBT2560252.1 SDR family NAD(P)-dependent oxidoreductase [Pedobacter sp. ISL-64]MBT2589232.1 SDR family NAD(P)-dependent oxidoreductase [Pedobacter sp. ISL-68]